MECGENGGDCDGDEEKKYFWWPGPTLTGRGDGGVGGEEEGEAKSISITPSRKKNLKRKRFLFCSIFCISLGGFLKITRQF